MLLPLKIILILFELKSKTNAIIFQSGVVWWYSCSACCWNVWIGSPLIAMSCLWSRAAAVIEVYLSPQHYANLVSTWECLLNWWIKLLVFQSLSVPCYELQFYSCDAIIFYDNSDFVHHLTFKEKKISVYYTSSAMAKLEINTYNPSITLCVLWATVIWLLNI